MEITLFLGSTITYRNNKIIKINYNRVIITIRIYKYIRVKIRDFGIKIFGTI